MHVKQNIKGLCYFIVVVHNVNGTRASSSKFERKENGIDNKVQQNFPKNYYKIHPEHINKFQIKTSQNREVVY